MQTDRWEEYDVAELGRLMMNAHDLEVAVEEVDLLKPTEEEREAIVDARYYAHKVYVILSRLAITASREWHEATASQEGGA